MDYKGLGVSEVLSGTLGWSGVIWSHTHIKGRLLSQQSSLPKTGAQLTVFSAGRFKD